MLITPKQPESDRTRLVAATDSVADGHFAADPDYDEHDDWAAELADEMNEVLCHAWEPTTPPHLRSTICGLLDRINDFESPYLSFKPFGEEKEGR